MAYVLNNTLTDPYANSYADIAYCDYFWESHYNATKAASWAALTTAQKTALLINSCRIIETLRFTQMMSLRGNYEQVYDRRTHTVLTLDMDQIPVKYYYYQALQFPRNLDRDINTGVFYIPEPILMGQCEQTIYTLNFDDSIISSKLQGLDRDQTSVGGLLTKQNFGEMGSSLCPMTQEYVRPFLIKSGSSVRRA